jgi:hypothetical protein
VQGQQGWGASPADWATLELILGLGEDLLPVVSNPKGEVSARSKLKAVGKVPSIYALDGKVVGLADWTSRRSTPKQIEAWSRQPDYGICLQTRQVRALDIDVEDAALATEIGLAFEALAYGAGLPVRWRGNSGKRLQAFRLAGDFTKRSFRVEGGLVEFLAGGQQFIAAGTHPSGARYQWGGGAMPTDIPEISVEAFEAAWEAIRARYAIEPERRSVRSDRAGQDLALQDDVTDWLTENWETFGFHKGMLLVACPWKDGHSVDSGETEAAWLPRGTKSFERGHFKCQHTSCHERSDNDFLDAVGYRLAAFEALEPETDESGAVVLDTSSPRGLLRDKAGRIEATAQNVGLALAAPGWIGMDIRYDTFKGEVIWSEPGVGAWKPWRDVDYFELRVRLEQRGFKALGRELVRDAVHYQARLKEIDTAMVWLDGLTWDGVSRIETFWPRYFGVQDSPYARACGLYTWTALAGRVIEPGLQADMVPILAGAQGVGKSRGVAALAPGVDLATAMSFHEPETERARKMRGVLVVELAELQGLRTRDLEEIKAWITRSREHWVPKYQEMTTTYDRRCLFFGTTNDDAFLDDPTGERRWLPMRVEAVDLVSLAKDREQLWAEGAARFAMGGLAWGEALRLGAGEHEHYRAEDAWEHAVEGWLSEEDVGGEVVRALSDLTTFEVLEGALRMEAKAVKRADEMRIGKILRKLGYEKAFVWRNGKNLRVWRRASLPTVGGSAVRTH